MPPPRNVRHILRVVGWNLLFILVGLLLIGVAGELYLRLKHPAPSRPAYSPIAPDTITTGVIFVPGLGFIYGPNFEFEITDGLDFWTVQRANSLGFLDREPIEPERAAESCHITIIGDSFVEANEVQLSDKMQIQL